MKRSYDVIVIGATCAGLGFALSYPGPVLVIEPRGSFAPEFVMAFRAGEGWERTPDSTLARDIGAELEARNCLASGRVHLPALAPVLYARAQSCGIDCLLLSDVSKLVLGSGSASVTVHNRDGECTYTTRSVVDTSLVCHLGQRQPRAVSALYVNAALHRLQGEAACDMAGDGHRITAGRFEREAYLSLRLEPRATWVDAREALHAKWSELHRELPYALIAVAAELDARPAERGHRAQHYHYLPSASADNPLLAIDVGARLAHDIASELGRGGAV